MIWGKTFRFNWNFCNCLTILITPPVTDPVECPYLRRVLGENFTELADLPLGSVADPDMLDIQIRGGAGGGGWLGEAVIQTQG